MNKGQILDLRQFQDSVQVTGIDQEFERKQTGFFGCLVLRETLSLTDNSLKCPVPSSLIYKVMKRQWSANTTLPPERASSASSDMPGTQSRRELSLLFLKCL